MGESLKTGVVGLKSVQNGVSVDEIEDVMSGLDEVLGDQAEIQNAMGRGIDVIGGENWRDEDLEDELNEILEEAKQPEVRLKVNDNLKLPEVPDSAVNELDSIMQDIEALRINKENNQEVVMTSNKN